MSVRDEWRWTDEEGVQRLVKTDELREAVENRVVPPDTLVWREGMREWVKLSTIPEFSSAVKKASNSRAPSSPPKSSSLDGDTETGARPTPTDVMVSDAEAGRRKGGIKRKRKRAPMKTLLGVRPPGDEIPTAHAGPIIVPSSDESATRSPRRAITQAPRFTPAPQADGNVKSVEIPKAPRVPAGPLAKKSPDPDPTDELWSIDDDKETLVRKSEPPPENKSSLAVDDDDVPTLARSAPSESASGGTSKDRVRVKTLAFPKKASQPPPPLPDNRTSTKPVADASSRRPPPPRRPGSIRPGPHPPPVPKRTPSLSGHPAGATASPLPLRRKPPPPPRKPLASDHDHVLDEVASERILTLPPEQPSARPPVRSDEAGLRSKPAPPKPPTRDGTAKSELGTAGLTPRPRVGPAQATSSKPTDPKGVADAVAPEAKAKTAPSASATETKPVDPKTTETTPSPDAPKPNELKPAEPPAPKAAKTTESSKAPDLKATETKAPETKAPETKAPETKAPETKAPETKAPETTPEETKAPETTPEETKAPQTTLTAKVAAAKAKPASKPVATDMNGAQGKSVATEKEALKALRSTQPHLADADAQPAAKESPALDNGPPPPKRHVQIAPPKLDADESGELPVVPRATATGVSEMPPSALPTGHPLKRPVPVTMSSLVTTSAVWGMLLVGAFLVGRCTATDGIEQTAVAGLGRHVTAIAPQEKATQSSAPVEKPCWVTRQPNLWAPAATKAPFGLRPSEDGKLELGFAADEKRARGLTIDPKTGRAEESFSQDLDDDRVVARVTPLGASNGGFVVTAIPADAEAETSIFPVPAGDKPFYLGIESDGVKLGDTADSVNTSLWGAAASGSVTAGQMLVTDGDGFGATFRQDGAIWAGWLDKDRKPVGTLTKVEGSGGKVGRPKNAFNHESFAIAFADKPSDSESWQMRVGLAPKGSVPSETVVIALPEGGPGGDAYSPDIVGLPDGRWLLMWTEGKTADQRAVRALTLTSDLQPLGDPIALSPPAGSFGQAVLGVVGTYTTAVFLSSSSSGFELWGAVLQCGS